MKKAILIFSLIGVIGTTYGQKFNVQTAANHIRHWELKEAKAAIDKAAVHPESKPLPKTWKYRAEVYYKITVAKKEHVRAIDVESLEKAFESYKTLKEIDLKKEYKKEYAQGIINCAALALDKGFAAFDSTDYTGALKYLNMCLDGYDVGGVKKDSIYYYPVFWLATTAEKLKKFDVAEQKYKEMIAADYQKATMYKNLFSLYLTERKDTAAAEVILKEARTAFPNDLSLMQQKVNILQARNDMEGVKVVVEEAIEKAPNNPALYYFLAKEIYAAKNDMENAIKNYDKTLEYDPDHIWASREAGAIHYSVAMDIQKGMNDIPINAVTKYNAEKAKADAELTKAVGYWTKTIAAAEKALGVEDQSKVGPDIKKNYKSTLNYTKRAYTKLKMKDEAAKITLKLNALKAEK